MTGGGKSALWPSRPQTFCPLNEKRWFFKFSPLHKSPTTSTCLPTGSKATIFCPRFENRFYRNYNFSLFCPLPSPSSSSCAWSPYFRCLFLLSTASQIAEKHCLTSFMMLLSFICVNLLKIVGNLFLFSETLGQKKALKPLSPSKQPKTTLAKSP